MLLTVHGYTELSANSIFILLVCKMKQSSLTDVKFIMKIVFSSKSNVGIIIFNDEMKA